MHLSTNNNTTQTNTRKQFIMKKSTAFTRLMAIGFIAFSALISSCKKENLQPETENVNSLVSRTLTNRIAYIFRRDSSEAVAYKALMEANNCTVALFNKSEALLNTSFRSYQLIVIDHNTDIAGNKTEWGKPLADALNNFGKPMLLLGAGGQKFAMAIGNIVNSGSNVQWAINSIKVIRPWSTIYKKPYNILLPASLELKLFPSNITAEALYAPIWPSNVETIGQATVDQRYYPVSNEVERYTSFGFYKGVASMTTIGKKFVVNLTYYTGKFPFN